MNRALTAALALSLASVCCTGSSPTAPSPPPLVRAAPLISLSWSTPTPPILRVGETDEIRLTLTATVRVDYEVIPHNSRIEVTETSFLPGVLVITVLGKETGTSGLNVKGSASGYTDAETIVSVSVDEALPPPSLAVDFRFVRTFWNELVFDANDCPFAGSCPGFHTSVDGVPLAVLDRATLVLPYPNPGIYLVNHQRADGSLTFSSRQIRQMRQAIPEAIESLTGRQYTGQVIEVSEDIMVPGWITIVAATLGAEVCGRAGIGWIAGRIELDLGSTCDFVPLVRHEIGHAMGFFHVDGTGNLMYLRQGIERRDFAPRERYHSRVAYLLGRGRRNRDGPLLANRTPGVGYVGEPERAIMVSCPPQ